ncbi:MAG: HAD family phosphatase [Gemmatimonadota bacterium]|nr:HAD family phosphatase [Gemmatimonadota bacterium]
MIKNILFDIGGVLVSYDNEKKAREFACFSETIPPEEFREEHVFLLPLQIRMERGEITPREYYEEFKKVSGCRISYRHFFLIWMNNFAEIKPMIRLGRALSSRFRIYFLSNTNSLHVPGLYDLFPSLLFFHGQALSYRLGAMKPERAFFERSLAKFGLARDECLFIDDKARNVAGAHEYGLRAILHTDPAETESRLVKELEAGGISLEV